MSGQPYTQPDLDVLFAMCAVSAATFNNALLYENARHSAREVQRLYEVRAEVIGRISHEFRPPPTVLEAGLESMENGVDPNFLRSAASDSASGLEDLVDSLLSLNQIGGATDAPESTCDAIDAVHSAIHAAAAAETAKRIQIGVSHAIDVGRLRVPLPTEAFRRVVDALLGNAVKFSEEGSSVRAEIDRSDTPPQPVRDGLRLPNREHRTERLIEQYVGDKTEETGSEPVESSPLGRHVSPSLANPIVPRRYIVVRVSDLGIGIPTDEIAAIAEPFRQASNSPEHGVHGKGLGLALAHKLATESGGHLCCRSNEGIGTTFSAFIPICDDCPQRDLPKQPGRFAASPRPCTA